MLSIVLFGCIASSLFFKAILFYFLDKMDNFDLWVAALKTITEGIPVMFLEKGVLFFGVPLTELSMLPPNQFISLALCLI